MAFVPALNVLRVAVQYISSRGESAVNVLHFRDQLGAIDGARVAELFDQLDAWYTNDWADLASNTWQTDFYSAVDLTVPEGAVYTRVSTATGGSSSQALPAQNTIAVSLRTGFSGRSRRGRIYHVGLAEDMTENSTLTSAASATFITTYTSLLTSVNNVDWQLVVASFVSNGAPRTTALISPVTNVILTDVIVDSMDKRKPT